MMCCKSSRGRSTPRRRHELPSCNPACVGAAFGKIVSSLVEDVVMPSIGRLVGRIDFSGLLINLGNQSYNSLAAAKAAGAPTLNYGLFLNSILNFLIVAFCVFLVVQQANRWTKKPAPGAAPTTKECPPMRDDHFPRGKALRALHGATLLSSTGLN